MNRAHKIDFAHQEIATFSSIASEVTTRSIATSIEYAADGAVTMRGDVKAMLEHCFKHFNKEGMPQRVTDGIRFTAAQARHAMSVPLLVEVLPSGAELHHFWLNDEACPYGVSAADFMGMPYSGIAESVPRLMAIIAECYGPEKHEKMFHMPADAISVALFNDTQEAIRARKIEYAEKESAGRISEALFTTNPSVILTADEKAAVAAIREETKILLEQKSVANWERMRNDQEHLQSHFKAFLLTLNEEQFDLFIQKRSVVPFIVWCSNLISNYERLTVQHNKAIRQQLSIQERNEFKQQSLPISLTEYIQEHAQQCRREMASRPENLSLAIKPGC